MLLPVKIGRSIFFSRSQAPAWERICARSPGFGPSSVTGSRGFPGKCVPKPGLGNEKRSRFSISRYAPVIPAEAGIRCVPYEKWIPASAGMTAEDDSRLILHSAA